MSSRRRYGLEGGLQEVDTGLKEIEMGLKEVEMGLTKLAHAVAYCG